MQRLGIWNLGKSVEKNQVAMNNEPFEDSDVLVPWKMRSFYEESQDMAWEDVTETKDLSSSNVP